MKRYSDSCLILGKFYSIALSFEVHPRMHFDKLSKNINQDGE